MKGNIKKIALVFGTRPEIIKLSPLMRACQSQKIPFFMIHTGQHYSPEMDQVFFQELELPTPKYSLHLKSKGGLYHGDHVARMMMEIETILIREKPSHVLVQGDTNTVLAAALTVSKLATVKKQLDLDMKLGHVEAGLRSYDRQMPEEVNRVIADHVSDYLFAPTAASKGILLNENRPSKSIHVTGNTIVDAVKQNLKIASRKAKVDSYIQAVGSEYIFMTLHRQENVDHKNVLREILKGIGLSLKKSGLKALFPIHPRTKMMIEKYQLRLPSGVHIIPPIGYLDCLKLMSQAKLLLTDSGGLQEEGCILKVPCVTIRTTTERPETIQVGSNLLSGVASERILRCTQKMLKSKRDWKNPFGSGHASEKILSIIGRS